MCELVVSHIHYYHDDVPNIKFMFKNCSEVMYTQKNDKTIN